MQYDEKTLAKQILDARNAHRDADPAVQLKAIVAASGRSLGDLEVIAAESPKVRMAIGKLVDWPVHPVPNSGATRKQPAKASRGGQNSPSRDISSRWFPKPVRLGRFRNAGRRIEPHFINTCPSCGRPIRSNDRCGC